jgi:hypothetical protein
MNQEEFETITDSPTTDKLRKAETLSQLRAVSHGICELCEMHLRICPRMCHSTCSNPHCPNSKTVLELSMPELMYVYAEMEQDGRTPPGLKAMKNLNQQADAGAVVMAIIIEQLLRGR